MLRIDALAAFNDNYIWLLQDEQSKQCAVVDPGDAAPVKNWLAAHPDWQLTTILITHHHGDHTGGILELKQHSAAQVLGPALEKIPGIDQTLEDQQIIDVLGVPFEVFHVPGHTLGHIVYHSSEQALLFSGDTLFAAGCGRLFEGTPAQMYQSLQRLARLPSKTRLYCTHEYTLSNLRFAMAAEPSNPLVSQLFAAVQALREKGQSSLPSSIELELQTNPFLRCEAAEVIQQVLQADDQSTPDPLEVFTRLRRWKDSF